jgi:LCP family protein required for cell wall assembly
VKRLGRVAALPVLLLGLFAWVVGAAIAVGQTPGAEDLSRDLSAALRPELPKDGPIFILAIGSDSRPGRSPAGGLADSLHIIGFNPRQRTASILGIPRDSYVSIPGGGSQKINAALYRGGPELVVETVERLSGIQMDGYFLTAFEDFRAAVSEVGGIKMNIPYAMSDSASGAHFQPGETRLDGPKALAFSRNRKGAPGGDFGRSLNQGRLMVAALRELRGDVGKDPAVAFTWILAGMKYLRTDLSVPDMVDLTFAALSVEKVKNKVVSGGGGFVGGASVVRLGSGAQAMFRDLARDGIL